jgi:hypothetical protein
MLLQIDCLKTRGVLLCNMHKQNCTLHSRTGESNIVITMIEE